jgi:hypothetical protein
MKTNVLAILTLPFLSLAGSALAMDPENEPAPEEERALSESNEEVLVTLKVPLTSPLFAKTPVATVNDEPITLADLTRSISASHVEKTAGPTSARPDVARLLDRVVTTRLIVEEARNIGLDEQPEIEGRIKEFSSDLLISSLMSKQMMGLEPDPEEVDRLYQQMSREFLLTTLKFAEEEDAVSFQEQCGTGGDFAELAKRFIDEGRATGELGGDQYAKLKDYLPHVAQLLYDMEIGAVSPIFTSSGAFVILHVDDMRFYEDPEVREEARQKIVDRMRGEKGIEYGELLERKYAIIDEELLDEVSFESKKTGFLWSRREEPVDLEALLVDHRVLATVKGDEPYIITVADLARKFKRSFYHGTERALEKRKGLDRRKRLTLKNMLFKKITMLEAANLGIDKTDEYLSAVEEKTNAVLFGIFINKVIAPDVKISEEEVRRYYEEHVGDFSTPKMLRLSGLVFQSLADAENALHKLRRGADFGWVSANTPGQVDKSTDGILVFDNSLLSLTALPEELHEIAEDAKQGDALLYSGPKDYHYVIAVSKVFPPRPKDLKSSRDAIGKIIVKEKVGALVEEWGEKLREGYETRIFISAVEE